MGPRQIPNADMRKSKKKYLHYITWALEHWRDFLIGLPKVKVETDHKPLVPLFTTKLIEELPLRIQRFRMQMMQFNITVQMRSLEALGNLLPRKKVT